jgi:DNA-binding CsgD family transcriptional regulator
MALLAETTTLDLPELFDEVTRIVASALPHTTGYWHTMDPVSLVETSVHVENMPLPDARVARLAYLTDDYNRIVDLVNGPRHAGLLTEATRGQLDRSVRYRELLSPAGYNRELRATFVVDGKCWGCFAFFRPGPVDFTTAERDFAHDLAPLLGRSFRAAGRRTRTSGANAELWPGMLLLGESRCVESYTPPALQWLAELGFEGTPGRDPLPFLLHAIAERLRETGEQSSARVLGTAGRWIQVHAALAQGTPGWVDITLQAVSTSAIAPLISAAYGLTARERELTELVLKGCGTAEIAAQLFISPHTVQSHLKAIFAKVGVRSRRELVGRVFTGSDVAVLD